MDRASLGRPVYTRCRFSLELATYSPETDAKPEIQYEADKLFSYLTRLRKGKEGVRNAWQPARKLAILWVLIILQRTVVIYIGVNR